MTRRRKRSDKLRDMDRPEVLGYELDRETLTPVRRAIKPVPAGQDYGADPIGGGRFRMVPSGDIVDFDEREKRLRYQKNPQLMIYNPPVRFRAASKAAQGRGRVRGVMSTDVHELRYTHLEDGQAYKHDFGGDVLMVAVEQPDGQRDIILTHKDGKPLWEDF